MNHARYVGDVAAERPLYEQGQFLAPVAHKGYFFGGYAQEIDGRIDGIDKSGRQIAHSHTAFKSGQLVGEAAAENEAFAAEKTAPGVKRQIVCHGGGTAGIMVVAERIVGDRYILALSARCAARLGIAAAYAGPQHIALAPDHAHHLGPKIFIAHYGYRRGIGLIAVEPSEGMPTPVDSAGGTAQKTREHGALGALHALGISP